jgi:hypothetical protein
LRTPGDTFDAAVASFKRGELTELELLAIGLAMNDVTGKLGGAASLLAKTNEEHIRARIAELLQ